MQIVQIAKKRMRKIIIFSVAIVLAMNIAANFLFYDLAVSGKSREFLADRLSGESAKLIEIAETSELSVAAGSDEMFYTDARTMALSAESEPIDWFSGSTYQQVSILSGDGLNLNGYFLNAKQPSTKTAILAHGYSSQGTFMGAYARLYAEDFGYNVLMPDLRAHGKSEGETIGFGWTDRLDLLKWIDFVIDKIGKDSEIVLHGVSMGGAAVLMTSGEQLPNNVKAAVSDCAYTSVKDELDHQLKSMFRFPYFPLLSGTSLLSKIHDGYFFEEASAVKQVQKATIPILFIHGEKDEFVPFHMVKELYDACSSPKELLAVPDAGHGMSYDIAPDTYKHAVGNFIQNYVK